MTNVWAYIFYRLWLWRKRHLLITLSQIICPILIIILFTFDNFWTNDRLQMVINPNKNSEKALYNSIVNKSCANETAYLTWYNKPSVKNVTLGLKIIETMKNTSLKNIKNLEFVNVKKESDILKFAVIHHILLKQDCYVGGIVFLTSPDIRNASARTKSTRESTTTTTTTTTDSSRNRVENQGAALAQNKSVKRRSTDVEMYPTKNERYYDFDDEEFRMKDLTTAGRNRSKRTVETVELNGDTKHIHVKGHRHSRRLHLPKSPFGDYEDMEEPRATNPGELVVEIRMANYIPSKVKSTLTNTLYFDPEDPRAYNSFLGLQMAVTDAFMQLTGVNRTNLNVFVSPFPTIYHFVSRSDSLHPLYVTVSTTIVLGQTFMVGSIIRGPAFEAESGFRDYLGLMGLPRSAYWFSWWVGEFFIRLIVVPLQMVVLFTDLSDDVLSLIQKGNYYVWILFLLIYNVASISFMSFIASISHRGTIATYLGATIWLLSFYFGDLFLDAHANSVSTISRIPTYFMCLNPNSALILGCLLMTTSVGGIKWSGLIKRESKSFVTLLEVMAFLVLDAFLYFGLSIYSEKIRPGKFSFNLWSHFTSNIKLHCRSWTRSRRLQFHRLIEREASRSIVSECSKVANDIVLANVKLSFGKSTSILDDINLQIQEGKITAILGPSGSGKTQISRLISGYYPPTSGKILIAGHDSITERSKCQQILSVCPQRTLLCHDLTVSEHLLLIARFRGHRMARARRKCKDILDALDMSEYSNEFPSTLVEIQKRKLSVAMTLIGKSKVVVFDRPTVGIKDQETKVLITNLIKTYCRGKTTLLLTSNLSEAYEIGERIGFLANGKILGAGTKEHLETCLKIGYHLEMNLAADVDPESVQNFIQSFIPSSEKVDKQSLRIQRVLEAAETDYLMSRDRSRENVEVLDGDEEQKGVGEGGGPGVGLGLTASSRKASSATVYFDAMSSSNPAATTEYPNYDEFDSLLTNKRENSLTMFLPKAELDQFSSFFEKMESPQRRASGIISYFLIPYSIKVAYEDVDSYMKLRVAKESYNINGVLDLEAIDISNRELLSDPLEYKSGCCSFFLRIKSQIYKRIVYLFSIWFYLFVQVATPIVLVLTVIGATLDDFEPRLSGPAVDNPLAKYDDHVILYRAVQNSDLMVSYLTHVGQESVGKTERIDDFKDKMEKLGSNIEDLLTLKYIVGVEIMERACTAIFSPISFHSAPASLSLLLNAILKLNAPDFSVRIISRPIQSAHDTILGFYLDTKKDFDSNPTNSFTIILSFGFFIFSSGFIVQPLVERRLSLKKLQLNAGLTLFTYWFSMIVIDFTVAFALASLILIVLFFVPVTAIFSNGEFVGYFFLFSGVASLSSVFVSYAFSFVFMQPRTSYYAMLSFNQVAGIFVFLVLSFFPVDEFDLSVYVFSLICRILQPYNVVSGFYHLISLSIHNARCELMSEIVLSAICDTKSFFPEKIPQNSIDRSCCEYNSTGVWSHKKPYLDFEQFKSENYYDGLVVDLIFLLLHLIVCIAYIKCTETSRQRKILKKLPTESESDEHIPTTTTTTDGAAVIITKPGDGENEEQNLKGKEENNKDNKEQEKKEPHEKEKAQENKNSQPENQISKKKNPPEKIQNQNQKEKENENKIEELKQPSETASIYTAAKSKSVMKNVDESKSKTVETVNSRTVTIKENLVFSPAFSSGAPGVGKPTRIDISIQTDSGIPESERRCFLADNIGGNFAPGTPVLNNINFSVCSGELLAIVGPNRSGKTALLHILMKLTAGHGNVFYGPINNLLTTDLSYLKKVGFAPSVDFTKGVPKLKALTIIRLFARLRGVPEKDLKRHTDKWLKLFGLERGSNIRCEHFTEAMRRKLSIIIALIGDPPILLFDEPLNYLDAFTKRQFWKVMDHLRRQTGRIIILTSETIEDVGVNCSQLAILVNGEIQVQVSPGELYDTYGGGYILTLYLKKETSFSDWNSVKSLVENLFPTSDLRNESSNTLVYRIEQTEPGSATGSAVGTGSGTVTGSQTGETLCWSKIFRSCQKIFTEFPRVVEDYYVSEETMRDIYSSFAKKQKNYKTSRSTREEFCLTYC